MSLPTNIFEANEIYEGMKTVVAACFDIEKEVVERLIVKKRNLKKLSKVSCSLRVLLRGKIYA